VPVHASVDPTDARLRNDPAHLRQGTGALWSRETNRALPSGVAPGSARYSRKLNHALLQRQTHLAVESGWNTPNVFPSGSMK
jgi:hypothetical protein